MLLNAPASLALFDPQLLLRLGAAAAVGLLLGFDREVRGHSAGLRTHGLVCFSAAAMTVSAIALYLQFVAEGAGIRFDVLRIYESAGAFIGILGAGLIVFSKGQVHNLTTAANLWLAAVMGIACGSGQWPLVLAGTTIGLAMLSLVRVAEDKARRRRLSRKAADTAQER